MTLDEKHRQWASERSEQAFSNLLEAVRVRAMAVARDEDLAQNVVITIMGKLSTFKPQDDTAFMRYVTAVTTRHRLKSALEWEHQQLDEDYQEVQQEAASFVSISAMSPFQQQVATSILAGYSLKHIAGQMNLKESTLRKRLFDARNEKSVSADI